MIHNFFLFLVSVILFTGCNRSQIGPPTDIARHEAIKNYGEKVAKEYGLKLILVANVTDHSPVPYCMAFTANTQLTLIQGRELATKLANNFLAMLLHDPAIKAFCKNEIATSKYRFSTPPRPENTGFKIAFWDQNVNRPPAPYLAEIMFVNNELRYYQADPKTQALTLVYKETYKEIQKAKSTKV